VRIKPKPPIYAAGIAMFEYGVALSINHSSLDHKKLDPTEFLVLCVYHTVASLSFREDAKNFCF
jgi:hypothetical protein